MALTRKIQVGPFPLLLCVMIHLIGPLSEAMVQRIEEAEWSLLRKEPVSRMTTFRGFFEISPELKIPVWSYLKISEAKFPTALKLRYAFPSFLFVCTMVMSC